MKLEDYNIVVIGLGYVGLPLLTNLKLHNKNLNIIGVDPLKFKELSCGIDSKNILNSELLPMLNSIYFFEKVQDIKNDRNNIYIICVPTPVINGFPSYDYVDNVVCEINEVYKDGDIIINESTVAVGATRKIISKYNNLKNSIFGFCPERVSPSTEYDLTSINKIISCNNDEAKTMIYEMYTSILKPENYVKAAESIEEAEACKIIENIQRDVNIALLNEYRKYCKIHNVNIEDVLDLCETKYSWKKFRPRTVSGQCIPMDSVFAIFDAISNGISLSIVENARKINEDLINDITLDIAKFVSIHKHENSTIVFIGKAYKDNSSFTDYSKNIDIFNMFKNIYASKNCECIHTDPLIDENKIFVNNINKADIIVILNNHDCLNKYSDIILNVPCYDAYGMFRKSANKNSYKVF